MGRRRLLDAAPPGLAARLAGLFSHPGLRHAALEAAEGELGLLPAGTTAALAPVQAASSAGAWAPLNSFLEAAAKYAVAHAVAEWAQKGSLGGPAAAAARPGSIDAYL